MYGIKRLQVREKKIGREKSIRDNMCVVYAMVISSESIGISGNYVISKLCDDI